MRGKKVSRRILVALMGMLMFVQSLAFPQEVRASDDLYYMDTVFGDLDNDRQVTVQDALSILKAVVNPKKLDSMGIRTADVDDDGSVTVNDALYVLKKVVRSVRVFPAELNHPELVFGYSEEELELFFGAKYYKNKLQKLPSSYMISKEIRIDRQGSVQCSGYAAALVFRYLGEEVNGKEIYDEIPYKNDDGTVMAEVLAQYIDQRSGYRAQLYKGTVDNLLDAVNKGVPVIILSYVSPTDHTYHFIDITGYDSRYIYMADSYVVTGEYTKYHNRKVTYEQFDQMWNTEYDSASHMFIVVEKE